MFINIIHPFKIPVTFTIMFIKIASNPVKNRELIPFGILLKISYCGVIFYHWFTYSYKPKSVACVATIYLIGSGIFVLTGIISAVTYTLSI